MVFFNHYEIHIFFWRYQKDNSDHHNQNILVGTIFIQSVGFILILPFPFYQKQQEKKKLGHTVHVGFLALENFKKIYVCYVYFPTWNFMLHNYVGPYGGQKLCQVP